MSRVNNGEGPSRGRLVTAYTRVIGGLAARNWALILAALLGVYVLFIFLVLVANGFQITLSTVNQIGGAIRTVTFFAVVYGMLALALNLHWGYTGLFNIGVAGFMAVGVYAMGIVVRSPNPSTGPPGLGLPLPVGIVAGMLVAAFVGFLVALPAIRLRADYLAIVTLGFAEIVRLTFTSEALNQWLINVVGVGTGAGSGMRLPANPIRNVYYVGGSRGAGITPLGDEIFAVVEPIGIRQSVMIDLTYVGVLVVVVGVIYWVLTRVGYSPFGRVLKAIREDELVARSLGKETARFKIKVFMLGCALMGLGGILWQGSRGFVSPSSFLPIITFYIFVALIIGGSGSNTGSVVGGILFAGLLFEGPRRVGTAISQVLNLPSAPGTFNVALSPVMEGDIGPLLSYLVDNVFAFQFVLLGVVLVILMQYRPYGVLGNRNEVASAIDVRRSSNHPSGGPPGTTTGSSSEEGTDE